MPPPSNDFCLKWNDHHNVFFASAELLCASNALCDVTLSAGGAFFQAHKLVLSICSDYFQKVFSHADKGLSTIVYMKDVDSRHMELILSYMYRGEITVKETELVTLLNTASDLQVKGLSEMHQDKKTTKPQPESKPASETSKPGEEAKGKRKPDGISREDGIPDKVLKIERPQQQQQQQQLHRQEQQHQQLLETKHQPQQQLSTLNVEKKENLSDINTNQLIAQEEITDLTSHDIEEFDYDEEIADFGGEYPAGDNINNAYPSQTNYFDYDKQVVNTNPKAKKLAGVVKAFQCGMCDMSFDQKWLLKRHYRTHTRERPYRCSLCNRSFSLRDSCLRHIRNIHRVEMESGEIPQSDIAGFCQFEEGNASIVDTDSIYGMPNEAMEGNEAIAITNESIN